MEYLFRECLEVGNKIKKQGSSRGHRYNGLLIQFVYMLRAQCSVNMYKFFRKAFNLPANGTLCQYSSSGSTSPDRVMTQTIIHMADIYKSLEILLGDWRHQFNLGWDLHVIKDVLGFCPHTKQLIGYAHDAFDKDVICSKFTQRQGLASESSKDKVEEKINGSNDDKDKNGKTNKGSSQTYLLKLGKHYMVFMAQTVTRVGQFFPLW